MMTDLITLRETSPEDIRLLLDTAQSFKEILERPVKKVPTLRGRQVVTLFYEASTRTRVSFENAAKMMSADTTSVAAATSSVQKGESLLDTVQTLRGDAHRLPGDASSPIGSGASGGAGAGRSGGQRGRRHA
jgi:aspartate carbamoyltransferase catalytic subunit